MEFELGLTIFNSPWGYMIRDYDLKEMNRDLIEDRAIFWRQEGPGDIYFHFKFDDGKWAKLFVSASSKKYDLYLRYEVLDGLWFSLNDRDRLTEVVDDGIGGWLTAGLFLPPEKAWPAIKEFIKTGKRSSKIEWINSFDMPPESPA